MELVNINGKFTTNEAIRILDEAVGSPGLPTEVLRMGAKALKQQKDMVYCKDCYWSKEINGAGYYRCDHRSGMNRDVMPNDYCSYGEIVDE